MSLYAKLAAAAVLLLALLAAGWKIHHFIDKGGYDRAKAEDVAAAEAMRVLQQEGIDNVSSTFAAKAAKDRVITQTIIKEVDRYVPNSLPMLPGDFRLQYNASVTGIPVDDSSRADALPVTPQDVARTDAENFASCRYDKERVEALQAVILKINPAKELEQ
jgi:hypothetical protein